MKYLVLLFLLIGCKIPLTNKERKRLSQMGDYYCNCKSTKVLWVRYQYLWTDATVRCKESYGYNFSYNLEDDIRNCDK